MLRPMPDRVQTSSRHPDTRIAEDEFDPSISSFWSISLDVLRTATGGEPDRRRPGALDLPHVDQARAFEQGAGVGRAEQRAARTDRSEVAERAGERVIG